MALNEIYLEIFGFYCSPSQKGSWPLFYGLYETYRLSLHFIVNPSAPLLDTHSNRSSKQVAG